MAKNFISTNQMLLKGDSLVSNNGNYKAVIQEDGNLVVYKWAPVWESGTAGKNPDILLLQTDTNLVMYNTELKPLWDTGNYKQPANCDRMRLTITDDGNLTVQNGVKLLWSNGRRMSPE